MFHLYSSTNIGQYPRMDTSPSARDRAMSRSSDSDPGSVELPPPLVEEREFMDWSSLDSQDVGSSFAPPPSHGGPALSEDAVTDRRELVVEGARLQCINDTLFAQRIVSRYRSSARQEGFCWLSPLQPSKEGGYIQVSESGANKFATLQEVMIWAGGRDLRHGEQASHLCCHPTCTVTSHVVPETAEENNRRKNCAVYGGCTHCSKMVLVCSHSPECIKFCPGFASWEGFLREGVCGRVKYKK